MTINKANLGRKELRDVKLCIRITRSMSKFMHDKEISPSSLFIEALKEVGFK